MFEIEAHYHDRKIYLSDGRTYPLGEILLRYFSMNSTVLEDLYDVCERAKAELNISSLFCPADIGKRARDIEYTYDCIIDIAETLPPYDKKHFRRGLLSEYFMLRKALNRTKESTISLHGKHQRATRKALAIQIINCA